MNIKHVLILENGGGVNARKNIIRTAKDLGFFVSVIAKKRQFYHDIVDHLYELDPNNTDQVLMLAHYINSKLEVTGVLTVSEFAVEQVAVVADSLSLPGIGSNVAKAVRNKFLVREKLKNSKEVYQPNHILINKDMTLEELSILSFPVVLKPLNFAGASAVRLVSDINKLEELLPCLDDLYKSSPINNMIYSTTSSYWIAEEYIEGYEISVEIVVSDGDVFVLGIHDKMEPVEAPFFLENYFVTPSPRVDNILEKKLTIASENIVKELGFRTGLAHLEFRIDSFNRPFLVEFNPRLGGILVGETLRYSSGLNVFELLLKTATGEKLSLIDIKKRPAAFCTLYAPEGLITNVSGFNDIKEDEDVLLVEQWIFRGDYVPSINVGFGGGIVVKAKTSLDAYNKVKKLREKICFSVT